MTNAVDIICESCGARMRLSEALLSQIAGRTGRITCKRCEKKVGLDASGDSLAVTYGGRLVARDLEDMDGEPVSTTDPHLSEFPPGKKVNIPPPVSEELKARRRLRAMAAKHALKLPAVQKAAAPVQAPEPKLERGSLSPHTLADDDDRLIPMGRRVQSKPAVNERDSTFDSLYPAQGKTLEEPESVRELPPMPTEAPLASVPLAAPQIVKAPSSRRGAWIPWAIAAVALFALGVSLSVQLSGQDVLGQLRGDTPQLVEASPATAPEEPKTQKLAAAPELARPLNEQRIEPTAPTGTEQGSLQPRPEVAPEPEPQRTLGSPDTRVDSGSISTTSVESTASAVESTASAVESTASAVESTASAVEDPSVDESEPALVAPFSTAAASAALRQVTAQASGCRGPEDPSGVAKVQVTFAPSGRVTTAVVSGPPYAGTTVGGCIASRFRKATVPSFAGEHVTVSKTVTIQ